MSAVWSGFAAIIVIAAIAGVILDAADITSTEAYSETGVRPPLMQREVR